MAKRIFEIAKELGVEAKAIVAKCQAEGVSSTVIKNHMSTVSAGLEQSIREWFSGSADVGTTEEHTQRVDITAVKARPRRSRSKNAADGSSDSGHSDTTQLDGGGDHGDDHGDDHGGAADHDPRQEPGRESDAGEAPQESEPSHRAAERTVPTAQPSMTTSVPEASVTPGAGLPSSPASSQTLESKPTTIDLSGRAAAKRVLTPLPTTSAGPSHGPSHGPAQGAIGNSGSLATPVRPTTAPSGTAAGNVPAAAASLPARPASLPPTVEKSSTRPGQFGGPPAPMNVPLRPNIIKPAGPKLENVAPVKLSGPRVVRIEAPEAVQAPRQRSPSMGGGSSSGGASRGPRTGTGVSTDSEGDRGRSPRRNGPGGPPTSAAAAAAKRSTGTGIPDRRRASSGPEWTGGVFSEQDLIEREARLTRSQGFLRKRRQDLKRQEIVPGRPDEPDDSGRVLIAAPFTIKDLSAATGVKGADIVKKLFLQGIMTTINSPIDSLKAQEIMIDFDLELEVVTRQTAEEVVSKTFEDRAKRDERPRGPVVTILGHVDHGKTSLLDKIRNANVAAGEAGGITQKVSAFRVPIKVGSDEKEVVFFDTPGHEAFTSMRARGAKITDVVVLVVSAPEGVMPQTIESINHAKAAGVPIVVALNKIDRPDATPGAIQKVLGILAENGLNATEWGGTTEVIRTSAVTGDGIPELLEVLDYQAQLLALKADFDGPAQGSVIEARMEEGRGPVVSVLVQEGKLSVGDFVVAGRAFGRVRDITDDRGTRVKQAFPPHPVQLSGLDMLPDAGDRFFVADSLRKAEEAADQRRHREREAQLAAPKVTLDTLFTGTGEGETKEIKIVLKADVQGSVDVLKGECEKVVTPEVKTRVLHSAVGGINESDVLLAEASKAIIIGFNVIPSSKARTLAEQKGVEIRTYQVIYDITDDLRQAAEGLLAPEVRQEILGHADVRQVFKITKVGAIAGCYITDGSVQRDALIRVTRDGVVIENDRVLDQLKRFRDDAREVRMGMECGMKILGYDDIKEGDVLECYRKVEVRRTLAGSSSGRKGSKTSEKSGR